MRASAGTLERHEDRPFRSERGQTAGEYMGILLLVAVIIGALISADVDGKIARATKDMVALIAGGGRTTLAAAAGGGGAGRSRRPGGPGGTGRPRRLGSRGSGGRAAAGGSGGRAAPAAATDRRGGERRRALPRLRPGRPATACVAARAPNAVSEKINERAREKVRHAQRNLYNSSARPGSPRVQRGSSTPARARSASSYDSRRITNNFVVKPLAQVRKVVDPRYKDIRKGFDRASEALKGPKTNAPVAAQAEHVLGRPGQAEPRRASSSTAWARSARAWASPAPRSSLYDNVKKDGVAKGITKTAGGVAGAWGAGAAVTAGCVAIGVATAGVGGLACAGVALGASYFGGKYGSQVAGWAYDRGEDVVNFANEEVFKPVAEATEHAVEGVVDVGSKAVDGGKKVLGAINPFG